jgi:hypothetical protein
MYTYISHSFSFLGIHDKHWLIGANAFENYSQLPDVSKLKLTQARFSRCSKLTCDQLMIELTVRKDFIVLQREIFFFTFLRVFFFDVPKSLLMDYNTSLDSSPRKQVDLWYRRGIARELGVAGE